MTKGSTPTIRWRFKTIPTRIVHAAIMTICCRNGKRITRDLKTAKITATTLEWTLTQEETLQLTDSVAIQLQYQAGAGFEGASPIYEKTLLDILRKESIDG